MSGEQTETCPWRDGNYSGQGFVEVLVLSGEKAVATANGQNHDMTFKYGVFGEVDEEIAKITGEKNYTVEIKFEEVGKENVNYGVLVALPIGSNTGRRGLLSDQSGNQTNHTRIVGRYRMGCAGRRCQPLLRLPVLWRSPLPRILILALLVCD